LAAPFRASRAQASGQFPAQFTTALHVERLIDGLVTYLHGRITRMLSDQATSNLMG
jgi:hypothetical protein